MYTNFFFQLLFLKTTIIFFSNDQYIHINILFYLFYTFFIFNTGSLSPDDAKDATPEEEKEVGTLVTEVSKMDDDLVTPEKEDKVPLEYSKLAEQMGELKEDGEI